MAHALILDAEALDVLARASERPVLARRARAILHVAHAVLRGGRHSVPVRWVGLDSRWLRWIGRGNAASAIPPWMTIRLTWLDQEYWQLVKRLVPDLRTLIGHRAYRMLDGGTKLEVDAPRALPRAPFTEELARRLRVSVR